MEMGIMEGEVEEAREQINHLYFMYSTYAISKMLYLFSRQKKYLLIAGVCIYVYVFFLDELLR